MKLIDMTMGEFLADIIAGNTMTIDEALGLMGYVVGEDGQIIAEDGTTMNAYYDDLYMVY